VETDLNVRRLSAARGDEKASKGPEGSRARKTGVENQRQPSSYNILAKINQGGRSEKIAPESSRPVDLPACGPRRIADVESPGPAGRNRETGPSPAGSRGGAIRFPSVGRNGR
jgi:hypothetical protein